MKRAFIGLGLRAFVAAFALVAVLCAAAHQAPAQTTAPVAIANCIGKPEIRPETIVFACAVGGILVHNLKWTGWGEAFAAALGKGWVNDCTPDCARGHYHSYPMLVS